jgi:tetratricopeptide (TPR) repeat protein
VSDYETSHLSDGQIIGLPESGVDDSVARHLQSCAACRERADQWREARALIASASGSGRLEPGDACPSAQELAAYALAGQESEGWEALTAHVVQCDRCAAILRDALDVDTGTSQEPIPLLQSSSRAWQRNLAKGVPGRKRSSWKWVVAAAIVLGVGASLAMWQTLGLSNDPARLLAKAYTEARPFDYRLPDAGYAPVRQQRGASSAFNRPEALGAAIRAIRRKLAAQPRSAAAQALKGRAELLEGDYESAIASLSAAKQSGSGDADALADLAIAHALRGASENRRIDDGQALDLLLAALRQRPSDPRIQFNLALTYEKLSMIDEAIEAWRKFLSGHPPQGWQEEAAAHLAAMEKIKADKKQADERVLRDPTQFMAAYGSQQSFDPLPWYDVFWTDWLPRASTDRTVAAASNLIATGFTRFGEFSLQETLDAPSTPATDAALHLLARAMTLNRGGHPGEALGSAREAARRLDATGLRAAAVVARGELVYAARWADSYRECRETAGALLNSIGSKYPWTRGNTRLDYASCLLRQGEEGAGRSEIETAEKELNGAGLWPLALRATQFVAGVNSQIGNDGPVWNMAVDGLRRYWETQASAYRKEGFHFALQQACSRMGWNECAAVFYQATIQSAHEAGNSEMEASNRSQLARLLQQVGDYPGEAQELAEVDRLLDGLGQTQDVRTLRWETALRRVEADLATKSPRDGLPELDRLAGEAAGREVLKRIALAEDRGIALQARGDFTHAAEAFGRAIELNWKMAQSAGSWSMRIPLIESVAASYRNLTLIQLMQDHDQAKALATWRQFRPNTSVASRSITLAVLPDGVVAWSGNGQSACARRVQKSVAELRRWSDELLTLCSSPNSSVTETRRIGRQLYAELLGPELRTAAPGTILLSTESWLAEIPFAALTDDSGEYLGRRFQFVQGYGPPMDTPAENVTTEATVLIVKAPKAVAPGQSPLPILPAAEREAEEVASRFPRAIASGTATPDWIGENAPRASLFHFSGHGWANGGNGALILPPGPDGEPRLGPGESLSLSDHRAQPNRSSQWLRSRLTVRPPR